MYNTIIVDLLDIEIPKLSGIEMLKKLNALDLYPMPIILVVSGQDKYFSELVNNKLVHSIIHKGVGFEKIVTKINDIIKQNEFNKNEYEFSEKLNK